MADPTKPSDSSSGSSPISPQIKIPSAGPQLTPPSGGPTSPALSADRPPAGRPMSGSAGPVLGPIPPNLPTKEGMSSTPTPASRPPTQGPQPNPDIKQKPPSAPPAPTPVQAPPKAETPVGPVFKSSIRTMQEDIAAVKKGQAPTGFQVEKQSEKDVTPPPMGAPGPKITMPPKPAQEVRLGELEKSRSLPSTKFPSFPPMPTVPPAGPATKPAGLSVPMGGGLNKKRLIFLAAGLVIVAFLIWFFALRGPSTPEMAISPTPTPSPSAMPVSIESYFSIVDSVAVYLGDGATDVTGSFMDRFNYARPGPGLDNDPLKTSGEPGLYKITNPDDNKRYTFNDFTNGALKKAYTVELDIDNNDLYLTIIYKSDGKYSYGLIVRATNPTDIANLLKDQEGTFTEDFKQTFGLDPQKATSIGFLDNTYQGTPIRYRNFPDPSLTIDYAIVTAGNGENYFVITNSREHMYAIIDKIK